MSRTVVLLLVLLSAQNLQAQGTVVKPEAPLDSARATLRESVLVLRDSLSSIDAAAGRLQRDFREASAASLLSRARVMRDACARSARTVPPTKESVLAAKVSGELGLKRKAELVRALDELRKALARCESDFAGLAKPGQGEQVRGYGNDRASRVQAALRSYTRAADSFLAALGIKTLPLGAEPRPSAG